MDWMNAVRRYYIRFLKKPKSNRIPVLKALIKKGLYVDGLVKSFEFNPGNGRNTGNCLNKFKGDGIPDILEC